MRRRIHKKALAVFLLLSLFIFIPKKSAAIGGFEPVGGRIQWIYTARCLDGKPPFFVKTSKGLEGPFSVGAAKKYSYYLPEIPAIQVLFNASLFTETFNCWVPAEPPINIPTRPVWLLPGIGSSLLP